MTGHPVEQFFLYGEPVRAVEPRFLHVEPIRSRSGRHHWTIEPHTHADMHQILFVTSGGGTMQNEGVVFPIAAPALIVVPAASVHAFYFAPETDGWVVTLADSLLAEVAGSDPAVIELLRAPRVCQHVVGRQAGLILAAFEAMSREFLWSAPARVLAIQAELTRILVAGARLVAEMDGEGVTEGSADVRLLERFRKLIEEGFRCPTPLAAYAARLGVSDDRLLMACQRRYGVPPKRLLQRRIVVEAQRWLLYTSMPVSEIARALGFGDPAYFSRFFTKATGRSPRAYRTAGAEIIAPDHDGP